MEIFMSKKVLSIPWHLDHTRYLKFFVFRFRVEIELPSQHFHFARYKDIPICISLFTFRFVLTSRELIYIAILLTEL